MKITKIKYKSIFLTIGTLFISDLTLSHTKADIMDISINGSIIVAYKGKPNETFFIMAIIFFFHNVYKTSSAAYVSKSVNAIAEVKGINTLSFFIYVCCKYLIRFVLPGSHLTPVDMPFNECPIT